MPVGKVASLLAISRWKGIKELLVVDILHVDEVKHLDSLY